jgi:hypothetical protein
MAALAGSQTPTCDQSSPLGVAPGSAFLGLVLAEETAVLIRWQRHAHALAVELVETLDGWTGAAHYFRTGESDGFGGLCDVWRGPYPSKESAIRNTVAHLVHHMLHMGLTLREAVRIYTAANVPIPARWRNVQDQTRPPARTWGGLSSI